MVVLRNRDWPEAALGDHRPAQRDHAQPHPQTPHRSATAARPGGSRLRSDVRVALIATRPIRQAATIYSDDVVVAGRTSNAVGQLATVVLAALLSCRLGGSQVVAKNMLPTVFWDGLRTGRRCPGR
ncbi:MAG: hypothetical protein QOE71_747 [Pseudonocardiales bacterium]|nr:hypothetical protein [Pseudonocardiales bacterium]